MVKPTDYAREQNISRQAVYAKIKKGILESKTVDGKIYIILDEDETATQNIGITQKDQMVNISELLASKEETISVLKESIKDLKNTNTEINTTLRGEIELLKQVFTEMRNLYVKQVDYMGEHKSVELHQPSPIEGKIETKQDKIGECWIDVESFLDRANIKKNKKRKKVKKNLLKAYQENDPRIKIESDTLFVSCYDFYEDML